jgi:ectoine hydroxylase-related dioxygenase (phytanoyl-CoA dioxygenase family)
MNGCPRNTATSFVGGGRGKEGSGFPVKDPLIHTPVLVVASKAFSHSNTWTKGTLNCDFDCVETLGVCSFLLFLDEVTPENGTAVAFWRHSKSIGPTDPRHPERAMDQVGLSSESFLGKEGKVHIWNARLLHRSLANITQQRRPAFQWVVTSAGSTGVSLAVAA